MQVDFIDDEQERTVCSITVTIQEPGGFAETEGMLRYEAAPLILNRLIPQRHEALQNVIHPPFVDDAKGAENA